VFSAGDPVAVESGRYALWKLHPGNRLASEARRVDDYEVAAVPDLVVDIRQISAGEFARTRIHRSEDRLTWSPRAPRR